MNKRELRAVMARAGDTQSSLAEEMGISLSRLNAKINCTNGAEFTQNEIAFIAERYDLKPNDIIHIFFGRNVSETDTNSSKQA